MQTSTVSGACSELRSSAIPIARGVSPWTTFPNNLSGAPGGAALRPLVIRVKMLDFVSQGFSNLFGGATLVLKRCFRRKVQSQSIFGHDDHFYGRCLGRIIRSAYHHRTVPL